MSLQPPKEGEKYIPFSRWDSIEAYISNGKYNDIDVPCHSSIYSQLKEGGIHMYNSVSQWNNTTMWRMQKVITIAINDTCTVIATSHFVQYITIPWVLKVEQVNPILEH